MQKYYKKYAPVFLGPLLICFVGIFVVSFCIGIMYSFTDWVTLSEFQFNGLKNFERIFNPTFGVNGVPTFWTAFGRTALFAVVSIITINLNAFLLALLLTKGLRGSNVYRSVFFMPNLIGGIVLGYIWKLILNGILGLMNTNLTANPIYGFIGLVILMNWQQVGYMMIIYIAALMNVPEELNESAEIDGAGKMKTTLHVTIPMVLPSITICTFLTLSNSFKLYDQNLALSGLNDSTNLLAADIMNTVAPNFELGASLGPQQAKSLLFFLIVAAISGLQVFATRRKEQEA
ncbi:MAG: sugar ABC transporter permease [Candidatus Enterosoma sp.]|nr:sugar ABC transporter permease [Candidatus Enterosoma sp.]